MIQIYINQDDVAKVKTMMAGILDGATKVMVRALNLTLTGVKTDASTEIRNIITAKKSTVDATFKTSKATATKLSATFQSTGRPLPLIAYSVNQTQKGVSVQVRKDKPRKVLAGAFIATIKSGHKGVYWRVYRSTRKKSGKIDTAIGRSGYVFNSKTGRYFPIWALPKAYRLPIKERFGPGITDYLGDKGPIMAKVLAEAVDRLHTNIEHELNFELSKL